MEKIRKKKKIVIFCTFVVMFLFFRGSKGKKIENIAEKSSSRVPFESLIAV